MTNKADTDIYQRVIAEIEHEIYNHRPYVERIIAIMDVLSRFRDYERTLEDIKAELSKHRQR